MKDDEIFDLFRAAGFMVTKDLMQLDMMRRAANMIETKARNEVLLEVLGHLKDDHIDKMLDQAGDPIEGKEAS